MAAFTSKAAGNWSASGLTTWTQAGVPGDGDTVTITHPVTIDVDTVIGTSPAALNNAINVTTTGSLTLAPGKKLTLRGDLQLANTVFTMAAGSILEFDSSLAAGTPRYKMRLGSAASQQNSKLIVNGTSGSHCIMRKAAGSGNGVIGRYANGPTAWGQCRITYCDFTDLGYTTNTYDNYAVEINPQNTAFAEAVIDHCTFTNCGCVAVFGCGAANDIVFTNNEIVGTIAGFAVTLTGSPATTGQRIFRNNVTPVTAWLNSAVGKEVIFGGMKGWIIENNVVHNFRTNGATTTEYSPAASFQDNLCVCRAWGNANTPLDEVGMPGGVVRNNYLFIDSHNSTGLGDPSGIDTISYAAAGVITHEGMVLDSTTKNEDGDYGHHAVPSTVPGQQVLVYTRCLSVPNSRGRSPGTINGHGNKLTNVRLTHNTIITADNTPPTGSGLAAFWTGSGWIGHPGMYEQLKDNLVWAKGVRATGFGNYITHSRGSGALTTNDVFQGNATAGTVNTLTHTGQTFPTTAFPNTTLADAQAVVVITGKTGSGPPVGEVRTITANTATQITVSPDFSAAPDTGTSYRVFSRNTFVAAQVLKNAHYNIATGTIYDETGNTPTPKAGYNMLWQTDPASFATSDVSLGSGTDESTQGPQFVNPSRNFVTFDSAYLGNAAPSTWDAAAGPFAIGDIVSNTDAAFFAGAVVNYRCILAHPRSTANSEPGVGTAWQNHWEIAASWRIRQATLADTRITDAALGLTNATYIQALLAWVKAGFAPKNQLLKNAASDGTDIGAVAVGAASPPPTLPEFGPHSMTSSTAPSPFAVSASSELGGFQGFKAFEGTAGSGGYWLGTTAGVDWLQLDIGPGKSFRLGRYDIQVNTIPEPARAPRNWTIEGSNNGTTWDTLDTQTNQTSWTSGQTRSFTIASPGATSYRYFRLNISANNGDATYTQVAELYLFMAVPAGLVDFAPHGLASNAQDGYTASASSQFSGASPYKAFDGSVFHSGFQWIGTGNGVDWLKLDTGESWLLESYAVEISTESGSSGTSRAPKNWTMEGSNDGTSWTIIDTVTNSTGWVEAEGRSFTCDMATTSYRYFRLNISANNGEPNYTQVAELFLYGTASGPEPPPENQALADAQTRALATLATGNLHRAYWTFLADLRKSGDIGLQEEIELRHLEGQKLLINRDSAGLQAWFGSFTGVALTA